MTIQHIQCSQTEAIEKQESKSINSQSSQILQSKMGMNLDLHEERVTENTSKAPS